MNREARPVNDKPLRHPTHKTGWIEVICGPMFSGKTEELIRRLRRAQIAKQKVSIFKPRLDDRYDTGKLVTHSDVTLPSVPVSEAQEILEKAGDAEVLGIDEAQFFDMDLVDVCVQLANRGCRVIVAGLDQDYRAVPFEPVPQLLAEAEYITKTLAICVKCGAPANRTYRRSGESERVVVGAADHYEARCRSCYVKPE